MEYTLLEPDDPAHGTIIDLKELQIFNICQSRKLAIAETFPALNVPLGLSKWDFQDYALAYGQVFLMEVLLQLWKAEKKDFICIPRNILIHRTNKFTVPIGEEVRCNINHNSCFNSRKQDYNTGTFIFILYLFDRSFGHQINISRQS